jgi:hypothetical protein
LGAGLILLLLERRPIAGAQGYDVGMFGAQNLYLERQGLLVE